MVFERVPKSSSGSHAQPKSNSASPTRPWTDPLQEQATADNQIRPSPKYQSNLLLRLLETSEASNENQMQEQSQAANSDLEQDGKEARSLSTQATGSQLLDQHTSNAKENLKGSPAKRPEIPATEEAMGQRIADKMDAANGPITATSGVQYASTYMYWAALYQRQPDRYPQYKDYYLNWKPEYFQGYADPKYFERIDSFDWRLREGVSASEGIKAWLKGLTIAECLTTIQAIYLDTIRAAVGDAKFDDKLGSAEPNKKIPENQRLRISFYSIQEASIENFCKETDAAKKGDVGEQGKRPNLKVGEWYYFANHPKYLLKHPGGDWAGENAIYMGENEKGEQIWSGLGVSRVTETSMLQELADRYNDGRSDFDYAEIERLRKVYIQNGRNPGIVDVIFDANREANVDGQGLGDVFVDRIDPVDIVTAPPYRHPIDGTERQGGFLMKSGIKLDINKIN